ncbi:MAG: hypothetical protein FVQ82_11725 [Planctomycetes bacterium]|nr:hypothetical protein [Planctomycetota bacterium]
MKTTIISLTVTVILLSVVATSYCSAPKEPYRDWLFELGAVPADQIPNLHRRSLVKAWGASGVVHGWAYGRLTDRLPSNLKKKYSLPKAPLTYERYASFLCVEDYKKNKSTDLYAAMHITLEELYYQRIQIPSSEKIVNIYKAQIGLERRVLQLLEARSPLSTNETLALYEQFADSELISLIKLSDEKDIDSADALSDKEDFDLYSRFLLKKFLARKLPKRFNLELCDFTANQVASINEHRHRIQMYRVLISFDEQQSWDTVNNALLHDPHEGMKEYVLSLWMEKENNSPVQIIDTVLQIAESAKPSDIYRIDKYGLFFDRRLVAFLRWASLAGGLDVTTQQKVQKAFDNLIKNRPAAISTLRDSILQKVADEKNRVQRDHLYCSLMAIGGQQSWAAVNQALVTDPSTTVRRYILRAMQNQSYSPTHIEDSVLKMVQGDTADHINLIPNCSGMEYENSLSKYLKWANSLQNLNQTTKTKTQKAITALSKNRLGSRQRNDSKTKRSFGSFWWDR